MEEVFKEEAYELLDEIESTLFALRDNVENVDLLHKLFRDFHTIKGSGAMFGFSEVAEFTHELENILDLLRQGREKFTVGLTDPFIDGRDHVLKIIDAPDRTDPALRETGNAIINQIKAVLAGETNVAGLYAAGDVTDTTFNQIVIAAGMGTTALLSAVNYLNKSRSD